MTETRKRTSSILTAGARSLEVGLSAGILSAMGLLLSLAAPPLARAEPQPVLAVFDVENRSVGLSPKFIDGLGDLLAAEMVATGRFQVVPRDDLRNRVANLKVTSLKSCYAESCQLEIGKELAAQLVLGTQIVQAGSGCHLAFRLYDLRSARGAKAVVAEGGCAEAEVWASLKTGVRKLVGVQLKRPEIQFAPSDPSLLSLAAPEPVPATVRGLDFDQIDVDALELYDLAVRTENDSTSTARQKIDTWKAVEAKAPEYANIAKERQRVWVDYLQVEEDAARVRAQLDADWGKLSRLLKLSVVPEADKLQWAQAFVEAYGADPQFNPYIDEKLLRSFLRIAEWQRLEALVATAPAAEETTRLVIQFLVKHPDYKPAKEAFNRLRRANRTLPPESKAPAVHN